MIAIHESRDSTSSPFGVSITTELSSSGFSPLEFICGDGSRFRLFLSCNLSSELSFGVRLAIEWD